MESGCKATVVPLLLGHSCANDESFEGTVAHSRIHCAEENCSHLKVTLRNGQAGPEVYGNLRRTRSDTSDELQDFRSSLCCMGLDQSTLANVILSWIIFFLSSILVPLLDFWLVDCQDCDERHGHPFQVLAKVSESALATVSFLCVGHILRLYGLRRALLLDSIRSHSPEVERGYKKELHRAFRMLGLILLPCFLVELIHEIWWFHSASVKLPVVPNLILKNTIMCSLVMVAWIYKSGIFLFMCVLFQLLCSLQLLRLQGYEKLLENTSDVSKILSEHMNIRNQLFVISHRFRIFMVASLLTITFSQFSALFAVTSAKVTINFFTSGDLAVSCAVQLTGCLLFLIGAAKITHKAQRVVATVSEWHAVISCNSPALSIVASNVQAIKTKESNDHPTYEEYRNYQRVCPQNCSNLPNYDIESFQKRQALVSYLHHCQAGISLYGFVLHRGTLYALFGVELSLVLWILGKTVGIH